MMTEVLDERFEGCRRATAQRPTQGQGLDSLWRSSVKFGAMQRRLAWSLRKDDTHTHTSRMCKHICPTQGQGQREERRQPAHAGRRRRPATCPGAPEKRSMTK